MNAGHQQEQPAASRRQGPRSAEQSEKLKAGTETPSAWDQTATGRALDFSAPVVAPAHLWTEIGHGLSQIARFAGQTPTAYSVAQHSVLMAEAAEDETGEPLLAAYCLLHDGHEAYLGDTPSPAKLAIEAELAAHAAASGVPETVIEARIAWLRRLRFAVEDRLDRAIFAAAGLPPIDDRARTLVKCFDVSALKTERRDLLLPAPKPWEPAMEAAPVLKLRQGRIRAWPAGTAYGRFADALTRLCPDAALAAGRQQFEGAAE